MKPIALAAALAGMALAASAQAQQIGDRATLQGILGGGGTLEDFESFDIGPGAATNLDTGYLDESTVTLGQGPGLVKDGAAYSSSITLQWNGDQYYGLDTKTILGNSGDGRITVSYDSPVAAAGFDLMAFDGFGDTATVSVMAPGGSLIESIDFKIPGSDRVFFGYQAAGGIGSIVVQSHTWAWSPIIDDHLFGAIPAPATAGVLALAGLAAARRRRN